MANTNHVHEIMLPKIAAFLWKEEFLGQISDGMWENDPYSDWELWHAAKLTVCKEGEEKIVFNPCAQSPRRKSAFRFASLREYVNERMIAYVAIAKCNIEIADDSCGSIKSALTDITSRAELTACLTGGNEYKAKYAQLIVERVPEEKLDIYFNMLKTERRLLQKDVDNACRLCSRVIREFLRSYQ